MKELDTLQSVSPGRPRGRLSSDRVYYVLLLCIIAAATFLRLQQLGADEVWIDEAFTGFIALTRDWLSYLRIDNTPPLYYLLQRGWCGIVTCNESGLRLLSATAGILFIPIIATFCRRLYGRRIALAVAVAAAVSGIHVYYSQEARVYALLLTVLLLFLYLQWRMLQEGGPGRGLPLFVTTLCALFLHYFAAIVIGTCLCVYAMEAACGVRRVPAAYFIATGGAVLLFLPWLAASIFSSHATSSELQWIAGYFADKPVWQLPVRSIITFIAGPQLHLNEANLFLKRYQGVHLPGALHLFNLFAAFLFLVVYVLLLPRVGHLPAERRRQLLEFSGFVILPLLALLAVSLLIRPVYVVGRYDLISYPAFLLLAGCMGRILLQRGRSRPVTAALAVLFLAWAGVQTYRLTLYREVPPYRGLKTAVGGTTANLRDGDGLLVATPRAILVWYYLELAGFDRHGTHCAGNGKSFTCRLFPRDLEQAPDSQQRYLSLYRTNRPSFDIGYFLDALRPGARVLLFLNHVTRRGKQIELDPVGLKLVERLRAAGYTSYSAIPPDNLLIFSRKPSP